MEEFLDALSGKELKKVFWVFDLIEEVDDVPTSFFRKLHNTEEIWEIRVGGREKIYRFLGFIEKGKLVILTHAFVKKTQKTPKQDIALAEKRRRDYIRRKSI